MTRDLIILSDLSFFGYHGVLPEEAVLGQRFILDLEANVDLQPAGRSDDVADTVSYADIHAVLKAVVEGERFRLLEALAQRCADRLFAGFPMIEALRLRIRKPGAPIPMPSGVAAVEITRSRMAEAWLSLGANLGDPDAQLAAAVARLDATPSIRVTARSETLTTQPWGNTDQPPFRNLALALETTLSPLELLDACQRIEADLGRVRKEHWGPRLIDLDIVAYDRVELDSERLTLPHRFAAQRDFVLVPLREIAPDVADWLVSRRARAPAP